MKEKMDQDGLLKALLTAPESAIEKLDLVYLNSTQLSIERLRKKNEFEYVYMGKPLEKKKELDRINSLVIPPAWESVKISQLANGHLQAIGLDLKQRKQYRYHPIWNKVRNQTKFYKMTAFGKQLPKIRKVVDDDLDQAGWPKSKVIALIIRLLEETHIRIGNEQYAKRNKTYGLSTLRSRHLTLMNDKLKFEFVGKRGKEHSITLKNKKLIRLVNRCEEIPGWELFKFFDHNGIKHSVESGMVNEYIHGICGELFTAKDFRTWSATVIFFESLTEKKPPESESETHKNILNAFDIVAKELGNTRNVCRKYYVHPLVVKKYEEGALLKEFETVNSIDADNSYLSPSEKVVLNLLKTYTPNWAKT